MINVELAPKPDPDQLEREQLRTLCRPTTDAAFQTLSGKLDGLAEYEHLAERVSQVRELAGLIRELPYHDYRELVGAINFLRDQNLNDLDDGLESLQKQAHHSQPLESVVLSLRESFQSEFGTPRLPKRPSTGQQGALPAVPELTEISPDDFVMNTLFFARMIYPLGVNIVNPEWRAEDGITHLAASRTQCISLDPPDLNTSRGSSFHMYPTDGGVEIHFRPGIAEAREPGGKVLLKPGESAVIGRPGPAMNGVFGLPLFFKTETQLSCRSTRWSRGGVLVALDNEERLYLLDRGSRNDIYVQHHDNRNSVYRPIALERPLDEGGGSTYGKSVFL